LGAKERKKNSNASSGAVLPFHVMFTKSLFYIKQLGRAGSHRNTLPIVNILQAKSDYTPFTKQPGLLYEGFWKPIIIRPTSWFETKREGYPHINSFENPEAHKAFVEQLQRVEVCFPLVT
jgi:hypothetical protein